MPLKKDVYETAGLRVRHTDNCFRATVMLEKKEKKKRQNSIERQRWIGRKKEEKLEEKKITVQMFNPSP